MYCQTVSQMSNMYEHTCRDLVTHRSGRFVCTIDFINEFKSSTWQKAFDATLKSI